jgi:cysteine desulfurase/selenocysteine lyase
MVAKGAVKLSASDFARYRSDFPMLATKMGGRNLAFLDTAASAQKPRSVIDAMTRVAEGEYSNIHRGLYEISQNLTQRFEASRTRIARFIGASAESIIFTRNSTEAINLVAQSWGREYVKDGDEIIVSEMEHHANIVPWQLLNKNNKLQIKVIPLLDDCSLDMESFKSMLSPRTKLVAVTHISNAIGTINNIKKIIEIAKNFNPELKVLIDGSQGVVHSSVNVSELGCDFYVFTGHKFYGPTGIGVLYGKKDALESMPPYQGGGDMIERVTFAKTTFKKPPARFEAGTPAIMEVIGLGAAVDYLEKIGMENIRSHEHELLLYATEKLKAIQGLRIYGPDLSQKAGIISFTVEGAHPSDIGMVLDKMGVAVRAGHHCCMPLMARLGIDATARASFGLYSNKGDVDQLVEGLHKVKELFS